MTPSYYSVLTAQVRYAAITPGAKLLYSEITALAQARGYCYASNGYFAELYDITDRQVRRWISELQLLNVVKVEQKNGQRRIFLLDNPAEWADKNVRGADKNVREGRTKMSGRADKNVRHNNINNTTSINKSAKNEEQVSDTETTELFLRLANWTTPTTFEGIKRAHVSGKTFDAAKLSELSRAILLSCGAEIVSTEPDTHSEATP